MTGFDGSVRISDKICTKIFQVSLLRNYPTQSVEEAHVNAQVRESFQRVNINVNFSKLDWLWS